MMKALGRAVWAASLFVSGLGIGKAGVARAEEPVRLAVRPAQTLNAIDDKVYGHFLEHIYHSCDGGLWGELVWNRSFEESSAGRWSRDGEEIVQVGSGSNLRLVFGDPSWKDYEYTLEAKKTGGSEGFLVLMRVKGEKEFYWYNIGGWGNKRHGLERGIKGEERWRGLGPSADGKIEAGRWYKIKVRCEGRRFQVWLDDKQVLDFTDDDKAHLSGAVGVGAWETQARYRNLKVAALDGKVLYEGVPDALDQPAVGRHWKAYGPGRIAIECDNPLNSSYCQRIVAGDAETGLEQTPFRLEKGEVYTGSVWARGKGALAVRLLDGNTVVGEAKPGAAGAEWKEYPFRFQAAADADRATLQIGIEAAGDACVDQVSLMPESWRKSGGFRPDLLQAVAELKAPVIRWPGGCFASAYRWKQAIGPQHKREVHPREIWDQKDVYSMGTDEFIALCRKVGAEPLIVVNIGTPHWVGEGREKEFEQEVLDWIEYCNGPASSTWGRIRAANGHPEPYKVKYWEIDNETWHMGAEEYARWVNRLAPLMRQADPSVKLAACGSAGYGDGGHGLAWNRVLIDSCADKVDYISIHHYENPDRFAEGPGRYEEFFQKTAALIAKSKNPALKIYCSEWNAQSTDWRTGLYCGGLLNAFERCGGFFEIGGPALFLRHVSAKAWDNAFVNFDHRGWFPAPNYVVMKLWRDHYLPRRIGLEGEAGLLNVVATASEDRGKVCVKVVNPTEQAVKLELAVDAGVDLNGAWAVQVAPGATSSRNTLEAPDAVRPVYVAAAVNGRTITVPLPAYSATVVNAGPDDGEKMKAKYAPRVSIDAGRKGEPVSKYIYGQFIEHLGRCIYGGIWAEMLEDRKFYYPVGAAESPWKAVGPAESVTMEKNGSFVGEITPLLRVAGGQRCGIAQDGLGLVKDRKYEGRIWLRGDPGVGPVTVSLIWGPGERDRDAVVIKRVNQEYAKSSLRFKAGAATDNGRLEITAAGSGSCSVGTLSLMPADNIKGMRRDTLSLLKELDAPVYRWPGGNFVSGYDWKDGIGDPDRRPPRKNPAWKGVEHNDMGIDEFMVFCRELDTEPYIAVNTGLGGVESALEELEYANGEADTPMGKLRAQHGHRAPYRVKWWGLGNEMYGDWQLGHMPLEDYIKKHNTFAAAFRKKDPSAVLVAVGATGKWSEGMMQHCADHMDLVSEHFYCQEKKELAQHVAQIRDAVRSKAQAHHSYRKRFDSLKGKDIRIALDEWNYWYGPHVFGELGTRYFLKDALGIAAGLNEYARQSDIMFMANYAQTVNVIGCIKTSKTAASFATTGLVLKLYREHFGAIPLETRAPAPLDVMAALSDDGDTLTVAVVNPTMAAVELKLAPEGLKLSGKGVKLQIAGNDPMAYNEPGQEPKVTIEETKLRNTSDFISVEPCSVTLYKLKVD